MPKITNKNMTDSEMLDWIDINNLTIERDPLTDDLVIFGTLAPAGVQSPRGKTIRKAIRRAVEREAIGRKMFDEQLLGVVRKRTPGRRG